MEMLKNSLVVLRAALPLGVCLVAASANAQCLAGAGGGQDTTGAFLLVADTPVNSAMVRENDIMAGAFGVTDVKVFAAPYGQDCWAVPGRVYLGQPVAMSFWNAGLVQNNPHIFGVGFGWVVAHEFAHHFQMKNLGLTTKNYRDKPIEIELQADLLGAYWVGVRLEQQAKQLSLSGNAKDDWLALAEKACTDSAFSIGESGFFRPETHGSKRQRNEVVHLGLRAGEAGKFGSNFVKFHEDAAGHSWMSERVKEALEIDSQPFDGFRLFGALRAR